PSLLIGEVICNGGSRLGVLQSRQFVAGCLRSRIQDLAEWLSRGLQARSSGSTSTISPAAAGGAPAARRSRASEAAKTLISEESWSRYGRTPSVPPVISSFARIQCSRPPFS